MQPNSSKNTAKKTSKKKPEKIRKTSPKHVTSPPPTERRPQQEAEGVPGAHRNARGRSRPLPQCACAWAGAAGEARGWTRKHEGSARAHGRRPPAAGPPVAAAAGRRVGGDIQRRRVGHAPPAAHRGGGFPAAAARQRLVAGRWDFGETTRFLVRNWRRRWRHDDDGGGGAQRFLLRRTPRRRQRRKRAFVRWEQQRGRHQLQQEARADRPVRWETRLKWSHVVTHVVIVVVVVVGTTAFGWTRIAISAYKRKTKN